MTDFFARMRRARHWLPGRAASTSIGAWETRVAVDGYHGNEGGRRPPQLLPTAGQSTPGSLKIGRPSREEAPLGRCWMRPGGPTLLSSGGCGPTTS